MKLAQLIEAMESIAPLALAEDWDNVGLILGDPERGLRGPVHLTIDLTDGVVEGALAAGAGAVVAYHPPIFRGLERLTPTSPHGAALLRCAEAGMAIYSPHTALDAASGGVADWLLDQVGSTTDRRAIGATWRTDPNQTHKLVVFVPTDPPELIDTIRASLSEAGAGGIGEYSQCSWMARGAGSFFGSENANPTVGSAGALERVEEMRLEMVCPKAKLGKILTTLRHVHPYEEPAFDLYELAAQPRADIGPGRVGRLTQPRTPEQIARAVKTALGVDIVALAGASDEAVTRVGVCPGSGESLLDGAAALGATLFVTGEMKHHETLAALERGISVVQAGHTETERGYLPVLAQRLNQIDPAFGAQASHADRPPMQSLI